MNFIYENTFEVYVGLISLVVTVVLLIALISYFKKKDK